MTLLHFVNMFFVQWLFVRLAKIVDDNGKTQRYTVIGFMLPLSGWDYDFIWLYRFGKRGGK